MFAPAAESVSGISQTVAINIEIEAKRASESRPVVIAAYAMALSS